MKLKAVFAVAGLLALSCAVASVAQGRRPGSQSGLRASLSSR